MLKTPLGNVRKDPESMKVRILAGADRSSATVAFTAPSLG
jgi:hypothetical protein